METSASFEARSAPSSYPTGKPLVRFSAGAISDGRPYRDRWATSHSPTSDFGGPPRSYESGSKLCSGKKTVVP